MDIPERINRKINRTRGCWLWTGGKGGQGGYGVAYHNGKKVYMHRFMYELFFGPIPPGHLVMHRCDTPLCCRPDHLGVGTVDDNAKDAARKRRSASGEGNGMSKLDWEKVKEIRKLYKKGFGLTQLELEARFGVSRSVISKIVRNIRWKSGGATHHYPNSPRPKLTREQ